MDSRIDYIVCDEFVHGLANGIVMQAAKDWREAYELKNPEPVHAAVREFFTSEWAQMLCQKTSPQAILEALEKEWEEIKKEREANE